MTGPYKRCKPEGNGYYEKGKWIKLKPHQRRFRDTTITKIYRTYSHCPGCGKQHSFQRESSQLGCCEHCGLIFVVTLFKEIPRENHE